jgi:hypothetical protein
VSSKSHAVRFAAALVGVLTLVGAASAGAVDRLDRFRALAAEHFATGMFGDEAADAYREAYALLDDEIVESLTAGGVFASLGFLQDRLDAFGEVWGGTVVRLVRAGDFLAGAFQLAGTAAGNSVRVYGQLAGEAALLTTLAREGRPTVHVVPARERAAAQFAITWEGTPTGRGTRPLRIDLARQHGDGVRVVWSTAKLFADGLFARNWSVRGTEIRVRYELRYPGWTPGCDGQTEQEDAYRVDAAAIVSRVSSRPVNPWHREFRVAVARLFDAVAAGDAGTLAALVPDAGTRARLPRSLAPEPACDAPEAGHQRVSVAARDAARPWQLVFQREPGGWRLVHAAPVLQ